MLLATNIKVKSKNRQKLQILKELTFASKNLYNKALYTVRQHFFENNKYLVYNDNYKLLKSSDEYKSLPSNASQQTLKQVDNAFKSFFKLLQKKSKGEYNESVNIPKYLDKDGHYKVIYTKIHLKIMDNGYIRLSLPTAIKEKYDVKYIYFKIPKHIIGKEIKEIHILPYKPNYKISFVYSDGDLAYKHYETDDIATIDLGIDNLATIVTRYDKPVIIDGKSLKSKNTYFNKKIGVLQSIITEGKSPKEYKKDPLFNIVRVWYERRDNYIKDYMHKASNKIIDIAIEKGIKKIVVGYNKKWKDGCNMGRKNNEKFLYIPHSLLLQYIKYKAQINQIEVIETEESYTSKADALALDEIPIYKQDSNKKYSFSGKRIKRGLYQSSLNKLISSDVNSALNILRKGVPCDSTESMIQEIAGRGLVFQPVRVFVGS